MYLPPISSTQRDLTSKSKRLLTSNFNEELGSDSSSPWARGTQPYDITRRAGIRFIPVGTGNTCLRMARLAQTTVHPRGHGEHMLLHRLSTHTHGSSPWARGTLRIKQAD